MGIGAVAIHEVKLGGLMALVAIIEAGVGDKFSVGRNGGELSGPLRVVRGRSEPSAILNS